jgi:hypothetical protein
MSRSKEIMETEIRAKTSMKLKTNKCKKLMKRRDDPF